jgi:hypothetical protein
MNRSQIQDLAAVIHTPCPELGLVKCSVLAMDIYQWLKVAQPTPRDPDALAAAYADIAGLRKVLTDLIGYALTARSHSNEWLADLAGYINAAAELLGDRLRAEVDGDHLIVRRAGR